MAHACGDRASQLIFDSCVVATSSGVVCGIMVAVGFSKECVGAVLLLGRVSRALSLTISVFEQKKELYSTYPMSIDGCNPNSCSSRCFALGTRNAT